MGRLVSLLLDFLRRDLSIKKRGHDLISNYCGWPKLLEFVNQSGPHLQALASCLFSTGARISEARRFRPDNFKTEEIDGEEYLIGSLVCLKKGAKASPIDRLRVAPMPLREPTTATFKRYLDRQTGNELLFPYSRVWYWELVQRQDREWWPHRFRTERASQLVNEYGYGVVELVKFFNWENAEVALGYVRLDALDLARTMRAK